MKHHEDDVCCPSLPVRLLWPAAAMQGRAAWHEASQPRWTAHVGSVFAIELHREPDLRRHSNVSAPPWLLQRCTAICVHAAYFASPARFVKCSCSCRHDWGAGQCCSHWVGSARKSAQGEGFTGNHGVNAGATRASRARAAAAVRIGTGGCDKSCGHGAAAVNWGGHARLVRHVCMPRMQPQRRTSERSNAPRRHGAPAGLVEASACRCMQAVWQECRIAPRAQPWMVQRHAPCVSDRSCNVQICTSL